MQEKDSQPGGCRVVEPLLASFAASALDESSERRVRDHLAVCSACRAFQAERDPSALFLGMRRSPLPDGVLDGFAAEVRRRLETGARPRVPLFDWLALIGARRAAYVAAPLMTLLLLGTLFLVRPGAPRIRIIGNPTQGGVSSPFPLPHSPGRPIGSGLPQGARPVLPIARATGEAPAVPPALEEVGSPGARVYRFAVEGAEETPIYFVVDESIDF